MPNGKESGDVGLTGVPELDPRLVGCKPGKFPSGRKGETMIQLLITISAVIAITVTITVRIKRR
jgi:hypothetical protein